MSRRLVAGLVALIAIGGVFAYGLSKQGDVSKIDTKHVKVPPSGFKTFAAADDQGHDARREARSRSRACKASPSSSTSGARGVRAARPRRPTCARSRTGSARRRDGRRGDRLAVGRCACFIRKAGWRYPIVSRRCCDLVNRYGVTYFPTTIVVDSRGQVVDRLVGPQTRRSAAGRIARARRLDARPRGDRPLARGAQRGLRRRRRSRSSRPASGRSCPPTSRTSRACRSTISPTRHGASRRPRGLRARLRVHLHGAGRGRGRPRRPADRAPAHARDRLRPGDRADGRRARGLRRDVAAAGTAAAARPPARRADRRRRRGRRLRDRLDALRRADAGRDPDARRALRAGARRRASCWPSTRSVWACRSCSRGCSSRAGSRASAPFRRHAPLLVRGSGVVLMGLGALLAVGQLTALTSDLASAFPALV